MEAPEWVGLLGHWSNGEGPMYRLLAETLQRLILRSEIPAGTQLPAERQLAQLLAVSRTTVQGAYDLLRKDEWVESRTGSGTWVKPVTGARAWQRGDNLVGSLRRSSMFDPLLRRDQPLIDLSLAFGGDPRSIPYSAYSLPEYEIVQLLKQRGYSVYGLPALRQTVALWYTQQGLVTSEDQILVTSGAQQAISLVASLYLQRGDSVLIENPTFVGAMDAFRAVGSRLVPVPIEGARLRVELLPALVKANVPQLIYVSPTCQNPTGAVYSAHERREIVRVAAERSIPLLEDSTRADLVLAGPDPPFLASFEPDAPILTVGSTSKLFWAGLRIGWVRAPQPVIARLARLKIVADLGTSLIPQAIAARLFSHIDSVKEQRRQEMLASLSLATEVLQEHLPSWKWSPPAGGPYLWVQLPCPDAQEFAQMALRHGTLVTPGTTMSVDGSHTSYLRLPYFLDQDLLDEGVRRLKDAWEAFLQLAGTERQMTTVVV
jgi:DNA-binding transcriptional MocR family regulator